MTWIDTIFGLVQHYEPHFLLILSAIVVCILLINLCLLVKLGRTTRICRTAMKAVAESPVGETAELDKRLGASEGSIAVLQNDSSVLDKSLSRCAQRIGLARFDAFPDIGGEQSFALAILDRDMNGVVVSNIYGRDDCRVYAKEISGGRSEHTLSDEEKEAIRKAESAS